MIVSVLEAFSEAFTTLRAAKVDHQLFLEIMSELFQSPVYQAYGSAIANRQYDPAGFALRLGLKDVRLILELAEEVGAPMPLADLAREHFEEAMRQGQENSDWSSIERVVARAAGLS